ncbi:DUF2254 domain-containing protein [Pseudonocardia sp. RS010]|uniref:DUF2254 domain-containing protein n=1 Tax=Pseudonocardia sp. RS010 TaxID=3385979 RepID=UPI0039A1A140
MESTRRRGRAGFLAEALRAQLWPLPAAAVVVAITAGVLLPRVDRGLADDMPAWSDSFLFGGGPEAARNVLDVIASSLITVTSLTFSLTVVTLQLASSQFSPRLLRTFSRDRVVHATLALFLGTFVYALTVLRTVRSGDQGRQFVPQVSVTLGLVLGIVSVIALVLFLAHLARQIRPEEMVTRVQREAEATAEAALGRRDPAEGPPRLPVRPACEQPLEAGESGFVVSVDEDGLLEAAVRHGAVVVLDRAPGGSVVAGTPLGTWWPHGDPAYAPDATDGEALAERVRAAVVTASERTAAQDVGYGLRQLADVAAKGLSPGINDPTTAVHALGRSSALLCTLTGYALGPRVLHDDAGEVRVIVRHPDLPELLELALGQSRRYGASDPFVMARQVDLLAEVAWCVRQDAHREAVRDQLQRIRKMVADQDFDHVERDRLESLARRVEEALAGRWPPEG